MERQIFDRRKNELYTEKQYGADSLKFLYETLVGRIILRLFISGRLFSELNARKNRKPSSRSRICPFIDEYGIDMSEYEEREYSSFADFFVRQIKKEVRPVCPDKNALIAVADSKLLYYRIDENSAIRIKNSVYTVGELTGNSGDDEKFRDGCCLVFRLTVDDYHHYCYFDGGQKKSEKYIKGRLHTVGPISGKRYRVYAENCRNVSRLETLMFGEAVQIEIGALLVGRINSIPCESFSRGEEKGWFEMGGSTCVVLLKKGAAEIDADIVENSADGVESRVRMGEKIGEAGKSNA